MLAAQDKEHIRARDASVFLPSARVGVEIANSRGDPASLELEFAGGHGYDRQHIDAGAPVQFDGKTFAAPQDLRHDFTFQYLEGSLGLRRSFYRFPSIGYEIGAGFAYASVDLKTSNATQTARENVDGVVLVARGGVSWTFLPRTKLLLAGAILEGAREPADTITDGARAEVQLAWTPVRYASMRAGYSWWWLNSARDAHAKSPVHLQIGGPSLTLELMF